MIRHEIRVDRARDHRAEITVRIPDVSGATVDLVLPSWVPGSYVLQDPSRGIRDVRSWTAGRSSSLPVERIDKARWRVSTGGATAVEIEYTVYGYRLITEAIDVTDDHLFVNAALCLVYVDGRKDEPYELAVHVSPTWKVFADLDQIATTPPTFRAADYDELVDTPVECGRPTELGFTVAGVPHRILLCGAGGNYEPHRLEADVKKIAEAAIRLFGGTPLRRYTFLYHLTDVPDGALEHRAGFSHVVKRTAFQPESSYRDVLKVAAHEYFHLYNVKRIRPKVLGPFDYTKEVYTRLLWAMEGTTDYYAHLLLRRSGLVSPGKVLDMLAKLVARYLDTPGRAVTSLELASLQAWVDLYRPYEESRNASVSYYTKGLLVSLCLDLEIRHATENRRSLDDVWRKLYADYLATGAGIDENGLQPIVESVSGLPMGPFFDKFVRGTDEIDLPRFAAFAGLELGPKPKPREPEDDAPAGYFGIDVDDRRGLARISRVVDGGPGRRDGLAPGDEIVALNGSQVYFDGFSKMLDALPAGSTVEVSLFRRGLLTSVPVTLGTAPPEAYRFSPKVDPTPLEKKIYESWLEATWEPPKPTPTA